MKKVILFVIDAFASDVFIPAIEDGRLPNFKAIASQGILREECISIFPSITPACLSSIITGKYPIDTEVPGDYWYDEPTNTVNYIGGDFSTIMGEGLQAFLDDFLVNLNERFLKEETLFEVVENSGLKAACLNYFIHCGIQDYMIELPAPLNWIPIISKERKIKGPSLLHLGDLCQIDLESFDFSNLQGMSSRFGFQDDTTFAILKHLIQYQRLPDFTVAYLPDNDWDSHELGPNNAVFTLEHVDKRLGELFDVLGGLTAFLEDHTILIVGDHAQSALVIDEDERGINLTQVLQDFKLVDAGRGWHEDNEIIACPNLRASIFYVNHLAKNRFMEVVDSLLNDHRIDQVIWRETSDNPTEHQYVVKTATEGQLSFYDDSESPRATDTYGNGWSWDGNLACVDGQVHDNSITFATYPNAFERLKNVLDLENSGDLWATAKPGYTFRLESMEIEKRGSHGTLHRADSTTSLLVAGHDATLEVPTNPRIVDVAPMIVQMLGLD